MANILVLPKPEICWLGIFKQLEMNYIFRDLYGTDNFQQTIYRRLFPDKHNSHKDIRFAVTQGVQAFWRSV